MSETYDPKMFIDGYIAMSGTVWTETSFSTDTPTLPLRNFGGWAEKAFSGDIGGVIRNTALKVVQDEW